MSDKEAVAAATDPYALRVGDEVDVDDGPKFGNTISHGYFVLGIQQQRDGHVQLFAMKLDSSSVSCPAYSVFPTGQRWTDEERARLLEHMRRLEC